MQLKLFLSLIIIIFMLTFAALACNKPQASPTTDLASMVAKTQTALAVQQILKTITTTPQTIIPSTASPTSILLQTPTIIPSPIILPTSPTEQDCTNKAKFITETISDDTTFAPGELFVKTWTLLNDGTCTWTPEYTLVLVGGEQMGGTSSSPIGQTISPNGQIQLFLPQTAPMNPGEYQGYWKLRSSRGQEFGLGKNADIAFWVKIKVMPGGNGDKSNLGPPTWKDSFDSHSNTFYLGEDTDISFEIDDGNLIMTAFEPAGDQWRVAELGYLNDFYLEAKFKTGECSGKDSYGLIIRAPDKPNGIINTGYVFGFSCEGKYRIYRMDNGNYNGIVNWTSDPNIRSGSNQDNTMGIKTKGDSLQLFANGINIFEFIDNTYSSGYFGLMIRSETTDDLQIAAKEIAYWILK